MRLEYEGLSRSEAAAGNPAAYALDRYAYYVCSRCDKAYYGGEAQCEADAGGAAGGQFDPKELVCGGCSDVSQAQVQKMHPFVNFFSSEKKVTDQNFNFSQNDRC